MSTKDPDDPVDDPPQDGPERVPDDPRPSPELPAASGSVRFEFSTSSDGDRWETSPVTPPSRSLWDAASDENDGAAADAP